MPKQYIPTGTEANAQRVLTELGFYCKSTQLENGKFCHSVSRNETDGLIAASIHPDIFLDLAITSTVKHFNNQG